MTQLVARQGSVQSTLHFITPTFHPAGGVVKIFDYVSHSLALGYDVVVHCPEVWSDKLELFRRERFCDLTPDHPGLSYDSHGRFALGSADLAFMSLPTDAPWAYGSLTPGMSPERVIHIIQGTRHSSPSWLNGEGLRQLTRPCSRIVINTVVLNAVERYLDVRSPVRTIELGHDHAYFANHRDTWEPPHRRLRVAYTTWKSNIGDNVAARADSTRFEFRAIRQTATWNELKALYDWSDVFLASPSPQEGFYLPGLEAMAAGALLVTPDVGGNMAYCRPDENCLLVAFEDHETYLQALDEIWHFDQQSVSLLRKGAYSTLDRHSLDRERAQFHSFLDEVRRRVQTQEGP